MAILSKTFVIIANWLIMKCWNKWNVPTKFEKNRTKPGNPYYSVLFENRTRQGTVLSETVLSGDSLYIIGHVMFSYFQDLVLWHLYLESQNHQTRLQHQWYHWKIFVQAAANRLIRLLVFKLLKIQNQDLINLAPYQLQD